MVITYSKLTALAITRTLRNQKRGARRLSRRCEVRPADPAPHRRWSRARLDMLSDNAWSPTESVVATMACLPLDEFGYGLGRVTLNERVATPGGLAATTEKGSRVPDILFKGTRVGINYDGAVHLNLDSIVKAAMNLAGRPGEAALARELGRALSDVRAKVVDDIMRNRELAADGLTVFPVVKEDLYREGWLDRVMLQVIQCIEDQTGSDLSKQRTAIGLPLARARRRELLLSMLPGKGARAARARNVAGGEVVWEFVSGI